MQILTSEVFILIFIIFIGGRYARGAGKPVHRPAEGLREGLQEQYQEGRDGARVLQVKRDTPVWGVIQKNEPEIYRILN